jgi:hypothetical protein
MPREAYKHAMEFFVTTVSKIHDDQWDLPGLGEWTVRDLVGHTARAMLTVAQFAAPSSGSSAEAEQAAADIPTPAAYYQRAFVGQGTNARIAERGRQTGASLGPVLPAAVSLMSTEVASLIDTLSDDHVFATLIGGIRLVDYLPTRTVELSCIRSTCRKPPGSKAIPHVTRCYARCTCSPSSRWTPQTQAISLVSPRAVTRGMGRSPSWAEPRHHPGIPSKKRAPAMPGPFLLSIVYR